MVSEKQRKILAFPFTHTYEHIVCNGAVRSGKTSIMTIAFVDWAMREFDGRNFGICSKTVASCYRNVITPYMQTTYATKRYIITLHRSENFMEVDDGRHKNIFYIFGGKDESSYTLIQGITLAGILLDEAPLMPQSFINQATARCSVTGRRFWFNCNPAGSKEHWFYKEWIAGAEEKHALVLNFYIDDNPSLSPEIIASYKSMYKGVFYKRYILGEWCGAEGSLFIEPPKIFMDEAFLYDGLAHIDASYGGGDTTAFTCARREDDTIYMFGRIWEGHVDDAMDEILALCDRFRCAPIYCETNGDKGYLSKELRNRGAETRMYSEYMNKYLKISTFLNKWWGKIQFMDGTDPAYIGQIMDYTPEVSLKSNMGHDDAPDGASVCCRLLDREGVSL